ncbi:hypothetical protein AAG906_013108 [Vitis piasezkii]
MILHNLDLALRVDEPSKPTGMSSTNERSFNEKWEHSNRSCLMVMKYTMDKSIKKCVPKTERAKDFLEYVKANYTKIDKAEMTTYLKLLITSMYDGVGGEEWTLEKLMSIVVQHEVSLKKNETHSFALVTNQGSNMKKKPPHKNFGGSKQFKRKENLSQGASSASASSDATKNEKFKGSATFAARLGIKNKKKDKIVVVVDLNANMIETNIVDVHVNSWCLYSLSLHHGPLCDSSSVNSVIGCKRVRMNLSSSMLWHKRLDFETCVVCLKGKMTTKTRNEKIDRYGSTLDLIHTDICGHLTPTALGGYKYFITFIDDFSRYGHVELIHEKFDSLNSIKVVKSNKGGEYYGRYDETGRNLDHSLSFNGVVERRNRTLLDMVRCMLSAAYILNQVPSKSMPKTPYELWSRKKPSLHHFHVWGCKAEVRPYNPQSKKLDPKTISGFFIGYCIGSRGSRFYCPSHTTRIIESDRVVYFEDEVKVDPNFVPHEIPFGEEHVEIPFPTSHVPNVDVPIVQQPTTNHREHGDQVEPDIPIDDTVVDGIPLRISQRVCRLAISDDYMIYLQEHEYDGYDVSDPVTYQEAIHCPQFTSWKEAMDDEMNSMYMNGV